MTCYGCLHGVHSGPVCIVLFFMRAVTHASAWIAPAGGRRPKLFLREMLSEWSKVCQKARMGV